MAAQMRTNLEDQKLRRMSRCGNRSRARDEKVRTGTHDEKEDEEGCHLVRKGGEGEEHKVRGHERVRVCGLAMSRAEGGWQ